MFATPMVTLPLENISSSPDARPYSPTNGARMERAILQLTICIPDDSPPVLRPSAVWTELAASQIDYHDSLPGSEERLMERVANAEVVLNIRASSKFSERVFAACPRLRLLSLWGTGTDHVDLGAAARHGVT